MSRHLATVCAHRSSVAAIRQCLYASCGAHRNCFSPDRSGRRRRSETCSPASTSAWRRAAYLRSKEGMQLNESPADVALPCMLKSQRKSLAHDTLATGLVAHWLASRPCYVAMRTSYWLADGSKNHWSAAVAGGQTERCLATRSMMCTSGRQARQQHRSSDAHFRVSCGLARSRPWSQIGERGPLTSSGLISCSNNRLLLSLIKTDQSHLPYVVHYPCCTCSFPGVFE